MHSTTNWLGSPEEIAEKEREKEANGSRTERISGLFSENQNDPTLFLPKTGVLFSFSFFVFCFCFFFFCFFFFFFFYFFFLPSFSSQITFSPRFQKNKQESYELPYWLLLIKDEKNVVRVFYHRHHNPLGKMKRSKIFANIRANFRKVCDFINRFFFSFFLFFLSPFSFFEMVLFLNLSFPLLLVFSL